jgi:hypothetical protein
MDNEVGYCDQYKKSKPNQIFKLIFSHFIVFNQREERVEMRGVASSNFCPAREGVVVAGSV